MCWTPGCPIRRAATRGTTSNDASTPTDDAPRAAPVGRCPGDELHPAGGRGVDLCLRPHLAGGGIRPRFGILHALGGGADRRQWEGNPSRIRGVYAVRVHTEKAAGLFRGLARGRFVTGEFF